MSTAVEAKPATKPRKQQRTLNMRERKLIKAISSGKHSTMKSAMISAGYAESTADKLPKSVIGKARVQNALARAMDKVGVNEELLAKTIHNGLHAKKVISAIVGEPGSDAKDADGKSIDFVDVPDHNARHKFLKITLELRGDMPDKTGEEGTPGNSGPTTVIIKQFTVNNAPLSDGSEPQDIVSEAIDITPDKSNSADNKD